MPPALRTIPGVELCRTGTWATSTGVFTFTREHFDAAVAAGQDPEVFGGPVKLGHTDPRFAALDGEPALGWVRNLRVVNKGPGDDRLVGDLVDVPTALAEVMPNAYPRRSVELAFGVKTPSGKRYSAAVIGLALLGVSAPAVAGLADLPALYAPDASYAAAAAAADSTTTVLLVDGCSDPAAVRGYYQARSALGGLAEGGLVPLAAASAALALVDATVGMPPASPGAGHTDSDDQLRRSGGPMPPLTEARIRELLNIEANADAEAALVAIRDRAAAAAQAPPTSPPVPPAGVPVAGVPAPVAPASSPVPPAAPAGTPPAAPAPVAGAPAPVAPAPVAPPTTAAPVEVPVGTPLPNGMVAIDAAALAHLTQQAGAGAQAAQTLATRDREAVLAAHCAAGRIAPATIPHWRDAYDANPAATTALLAQLPVAFATAPIGDGGNPAGVADALSDEAWDQFSADLGWTDPKPATK